MPGRGEPGPGQPVRRDAGRARSLGLLRTVLFAPEDLALVKGDPDGRRRFLDDLLVARPPRYAGVRADYDRVLRQRNALLKSAGATIRAGRGDVRTLDVWDTPPGDGRGRAAGRPAAAGRSCSPRWSRPPTRRSARGRADAVTSYRCSLGEDVTAEDPPTRELLPARLLEALAPGPHAGARARHQPGRPAPRRPGAGPAAGCRPRATPATASPGRSRWRCGWPATSCCAPTAWPAGRRAGADAGRRVRRARHPAAATAWPTLVARAEQVLVTAAVAAGRARRRWTAPGST